MKRTILCSILLFLCVSINSQTIVKFNLKPNGTFLADDEKSFVVVEFNGKTAQELYSMVKSNVMTLYNSPKTVMSENEPNSLSIRALSGVIHETYKLGGGFVSYKAYYNLVFHFKDGRIKVDAPVIDGNLNVNATGVPIPKTFVSLVDDWFDKKGNVKNKSEKNKKKIEATFNYPINYLLGNYKDNNQSEENW